MALIWRECMFWSLSLQVNWVILKSVVGNYEFTNLSILMRNVEFIKFIYYVDGEKSIIVGYTGGDRNFMILLGYFKFKTLCKNPTTIIDYLSSLNWYELNYKTHVCIWAANEYQQIMGAFLDQVFDDKSNPIPTSWGSISRNQTIAKDIDERHQNYGGVYRNWLKNNVGLEPFPIKFLIWYEKNYLH